MIKILLVPALILSLSAQAEDLEALLEGKAETQQNLSNNFLVQSMMSEIKNIHSEQDIFLRKLGSSEWKDALLQWKAAFAGHEFEKTTNAQALHAYLYFKSGMPLVGLEKLFQIQEPKKIHFQLINAWREAAPASNPAWLTSQIQWKQEWAEIFGPAIGVQVQTSDISVMSDLALLEKMSAGALANSKERALIDWNLALAYAKLDKTDQAAKLISSLMKAKNNPVPMDLMNLTAARMLYQKGYYEAAIRYYDKIQKSSEDYLEAQEEKAWSFIRKGEPQNALAVTQSLIHPSLTAQVGPETWFVRSLALLKVCDYSNTISTLGTFPNEFKIRTLELEKISQNANTETVKNILEKLKTSSLTRADVVKVNKFLPRLLVRDEKLRRLLLSQTILENESQAAEKIYARSLQLTGLQGTFDALKNQVNQRFEMAKANSFSRVQELAKNEVDETKKILNKLHIVEAEVIQQVEVATKLMTHLSTPTENKEGSAVGKVASNDVLKFPLEKEFWFDELSNYKVNIKKGCQAKNKPINQEIK